MKQLQRKEKGFMKHRPMKCAIAGSLVALGLICSGSAGAENARSAGSLVLWYRQPAESGSVKGLRARGGFEVDMTWKDGKLTQAGIRSKVQGPCTVRYGDKTVTLHMKEGESIKLDGGMRK